MSANLAVSTPDRAYLLADAAVYDRKGVLTDIRSKIVLLRHLKAAGSCRGNLMPLALMATATEDFASWDDFRPNAPAVFEALHRIMVIAVPGRHWEMTLVGWSDERERAELIFYATHGNFPAEWNQSGPTLLTDFMVPNGPGLEDALKCQGIDFDPILHGIPAFDAAHRTLADLHCGQEPEPLMAYSVGGFLQLVTISRAGARSELLTQWAEDEIGRPIQPQFEDELCLNA